MPSTRGQINNQTTRVTRKGTTILQGLTHASRAKSGQKVARIVVPTVESVQLEPSIVAQFDLTVPEARVTRAKRGQKTVPIVPEPVPTETAADLLSIETVPDQVSESVSPETVAEPVPNPVPELTIPEARVTRAKRGQKAVPVVPEPVPTETVADLLSIETVPDQVSEPVPPETVAEPVPNPVPELTIPEARVTRAKRGQKAVPVVPEPVPTETAADLLSIETVPDQVSEPVPPETVAEPVPNLVQEPVPTETAADFLSIETVPDQVSESLPTETVAEPLPNPVQDPVPTEIAADPLSIETVPEIVPDPVQEPVPTDTVKKVKKVRRDDLILGQLDAHFTKMFIDVAGKISHKYCAPPEDFFTFVATEKVKKLADDLLTSYASSFEYVKYASKTGYFSDSDEICVKARKNIVKKFVIPGLDGYMATVPEGETVPDFSMFSNNGGLETIMLGPASFINHHCKPNAKFVCGGESRGKMIIRIETLRHIDANEEIFVHYSDHYFGQNNCDCRCESCLDKIFAQPQPEPLSRNAATLTPTQVPSPESPLASTITTTQVPSPESPLASTKTTTQVPSPETPLASTITTTQVPSPETPLASTLTTTLELDATPPSVIVIPTQKVARTDATTKVTKKVKHAQLTECLVCDQSVKRLDRHLLSVHKEFTVDEVKVINNFVRMRSAHGNANVWYCEEHAKQFVDKRSHKRHYKCSLEQVSKIENHQSRKCLPMEIRMKLKNSTLASEEHLHLVDQFLAHNHHLRHGTYSLEDEDPVKGKQALRTTLALLFRGTNALANSKNLTAAVNRYINFVDGK